MSNKRNVVVTIAANVGAAGIGAISVAIISRAAGNEGIGVFGLLRVLPLLLGIVTEMGIANASPYLVNNQKISAQEVLSSALFAGLLTSLLDALVWVAVSPLLHSVFFGSLTLSWVMLGAFIAPLNVFQHDIDNLLRALRDYRWVNFTRVLVEASTTIAILVFYLTGELEPHEIVISILIGRCLALVASSARAWARGLAPVPGWRPEVLRKAFKFGITTQVGRAVNTLNLRLDHMVLGAMTSTATVGTYVVATKAAEVLKFLSPAVRFVLEPAIARQSRDNALERAKRLYWRVFAVNVAVMVIGFLMGPVLIPWLFDDWSQASVLPFRILLLGLAANGASGVIAAYNLGHGKPQNNAIPAVCALVLTLLLDLLLIPVWGIEGAAIASSAAYSAAAAFLGLLFVRELRRPSPIEPPQDGAPTPVDVAADDGLG